MNKIKFDKESNLYYRTETSDKVIIAEQATYNKFLERCKGMIVLDLGANIGAFSNRALEEGAKKVFGFEPDPDNIALIKKQPFYKDKRFKLIEKAVSDKTGVAYFYKNVRRHKGMHSLLYKRGRETIEVKTISLNKVLDKVNPDGIKLDIEGAEFIIDFNRIIESNIKLLAMEMHLGFNLNNKKTLYYAKKVKKLLDDNFEELTTFSQSKVSEDKYGQTALYIGVR